jgi:hypothetical protein
LVIAQLVLMLACFRRMTDALDNATLTTEFEHRTAKRMTDATD